MNRDAIETLYRGYVAAGHASSEHLPTIRHLASECNDCAELGTKHGASATALLLGCIGTVWSVDIAPTPRAQALRALTGDRWNYVIGDSRTTELPLVDLMFVDSMHSYEHVRAELATHANRVHKYLIFHDWLTAGSVSLVAETGEQSWRYTRGQSVPKEHLGIMPAILELLQRDRSWQVRDVITESHGLLILERER